MAATYIAAWLTEEQAQQLAVEDGEDPASLHLTLAYLGDIDEAATMRAGHVLAQIARSTPPLEATISGTGRFLEQDGEGDCIYYSVDSPALTRFRSQLVADLARSGVAIDETHGFTPHITAAYGDADEDIDILEQPLTLTLASVCIESPDSVERIDIPLTGPTGAVAKRQEVAAAPERVEVVIKDSPTSSDSHVDVPLGSSSTKRPRRKRKRAAAETVTVVKLDEMRRIVYGVVLEPHMTDSQGDWERPIEIEKAAHRYLSKSIRGTTRVHTVQHKIRSFFRSGGGLVPVESFIAPCDFSYDGGTDVIRKGSWVLAAHIEDTALWKDVLDGKFTGWSVGGSGRRVEIVSRTI